MIIGILSDSHGDRPRTAEAVQVLRRHGAEAFIHCGDVGGEFVLADLAGLRVWFVWGNTDSPDASLERYVQSLGLPLPECVPLRLQLAGRSLAVFHGHEPQFTRLTRLVQAERPDALARLMPGCDYVLHGHTHRASDLRVGPVRFINPGALYRARTHTVATLDLKQDRVEFWEVNDR
ncbi:MAG: metallophosphatase family protein [Planctomycetes bacterium]|nr:metallophosphatase family protein [Planctomycetota bacterium]